MLHNTALSIDCANKCIFWHGLTVLILARLRFIVFADDSRIWFAVRGWISLRSCRRNFRRGLLTRRRNGPFKLPSVRSVTSVAAWICPIWQVAVALVECTQLGWLLALEASYAARPEHFLMHRGRLWKLRRLVTLASTDCGPSLMLTCMLSSWLCHTFSTSTRRRQRKERVQVRRDLSVLPMLYYHCFTAVIQNCLC